MKGATLIFYFFLLTCIVETNNALAYGKRIVLDFHDMKLRSNQRMPTALFLKKELQAQHPRLDYSQFDLKKVILVAKSKHGWGQARLRVGRNITPPSRVSGRAPGSGKQHSVHFDRIKFQNPSLRSKGVWQLLLHGKFIVRQVELVFQPRHRNHRGGSYGWNKEQSIGWYFSLHRNKGYRFEDRLERLQEHW